MTAVAKAAVWGAVIIAWFVLPGFLPRLYGIVNTPTYMRLVLSSACYAGMSWLILTYTSHSRLRTAMAASLIMAGIGATFVGLSAALVIGKEWAADAESVSFVVIATITFSRWLEARGCSGAPT